MPPASSKACDTPNSSQNLGVKGHKLSGMAEQNPCGTYAAYVRHRRVPETACDACKAAKQRYEQQKRATRIEKMDSLTHGTATTWDAGCRCNACKDHHNARRYLDHGITEQQFLRLLEDQGFGCALCGERSALRGRVTRLSVDHDHDCCSGKTGCPRCVRGLLCHRCNVWGSRKMPELWAAYVERPRPFVTRVIG